MAVIVKGMDIPLGCCYEDYNGGTGYCPFCDTHDVPYCVLEPSHLVSEELLFIEVDSRPDWCPLVEIPEGVRLIDGNGLYKEVKTECNPYGKPSLEFKSGTRVMDMINKAQTIYEEEQDD